MKNLAQILVTFGFIIMTILMNACSVLQNMDLGTNTKVENDDQESKKGCPKKYCPNSRDKLAKLLKSEDVYLSDIDTSKITDMSFLFGNFIDKNGESFCTKGYLSKKQKDKCENSASHRKNFSGLESWDTSKVKDMAYMFYNQTLFNEDISSWNVANVRNMAYMFFGAKVFNQPLNRWNVANVKDMKFMFANTESFNQPLENWNVRNVKDMQSLFANAKAFNQPLNRWNVVNVKDMANMFFGAKVFNQNISSWNVANVRNMAYMFMSAESFNQNIQSWNVNKAQNMSWMFEYSPLRYYPPKWYAPWKNKR